MIGRPAPARLARRSVIGLTAAALAAGQERAGDGLTGETAAAASPVALGAFVDGAPGNRRRLDAFADKIGRMPAIVMWYQAWAGSQAPFEPALPAAVANRAATPIITWEPWNPANGPHQPDYRLARIASGDFDAYLDDWGSALATYGDAIYLRFAHEMNGDWYPWAAGTNGNTAEDYVAAWRHVHDRVSAAAGNVRWIWSPNVVAPGSVPLDRLYPGAGYVDWVGLDGYNWGGRTRKQWRSFTQVFAATYDEVTSLTDKPLMIAETASAERGGNKAAWITHAFDALPDHFPRARAVVWFNANKERDWRVNSSPESLQAFRAAARSPLLQGTFP